MHNSAQVFLQGPERRLASAENKIPRQTLESVEDFLEKENPAIVAGFNKGYADERKSSKYDIISLTCQSK